MTGHHPAAQTSLNDFGQALMRLMVRHGLASVRPRAGTGFLGLIGEGKFVTSDLAFTFLPPAEHRAAAQAVGMEVGEFLLASGQRGAPDIERFARAAGGLFDDHGVLNLEFPQGAHLGFKNTGQGMEFVTEGVHLTLREDPTGA